MSVKKQQNMLRQAVIASGNIRPSHSTQVSEIRHTNSAESRAAAIAARRAEMNRVSEIISKGTK